MKTTRHAKSPLSRGKNHLNNFAQIHGQLIIAINGKQISAVTAIDFKKQAVSYLDLKTSEEKTIIGDIVLFVDKSKL